MMAKRKGMINNGGSPWANGREISRRKPTKWKERTEIRRERAECATAEEEIMESLGQ